MSHNDVTPYPVIHNRETAGNSMKEKIIVAQEAIDAYELATGFVGIGRFFEERGIWTIVKQGVSCPAQK